MKYLVCILFLFASGSQVFSQAKPITGEEFSQVYFSALDKAREIPRRHTSRMERLRDGKVVEIESWLYEYTLPYKRRFIYSKGLESLSKIEEINIDENNYCRFEAKPWEKRDVNCIQGFAATTSQAAIQVLGIISAKHSVESIERDGIGITLFSEYITFMTPSAYSEDRRGRFLKRAYWLNGQGLVIREESTIGITTTNELTSKWIDLHEYNPKGLSIEAPIK